MIPETLKQNLLKHLSHVDHARELAIDVIFAFQEHYGYLCDDALVEAAEILDMSPLELEELATFYPFAYREPVGKFVIHVCDSVICWMNGSERICDYLCKKLNIRIGETTQDGLFTLLPVCCIGYCDESPAMLINRQIYSHLTTMKIDDILDELKRSESTQPEKNE